MTSKAFAHIDSGDCDISSTYLLMETHLEQQSLALTHSRMIKMSKFFLLLLLSDASGTNLQVANLNKMQQLLNLKQSEAHASQTDMIKLHDCVTVWSMSLNRQ